MVPRPEVVVAVIHFVRPEAFLLAVPVILLLRRRMLERPVVLALRMLALLGALALIAEPYLPGAESGRDLVIALDRSFSAPQNGVERATESSQLARAQSASGDRIGLVAFGRDAAIEIPPTQDFRWTPPTRTLDRDGTDLSLAIESALALIPEGRQGSVLLISDGENNGKDPQLAIQEAQRRGIRIDTIPLLRESKVDVAIEDVGAPATVASGEPFQFTAFVRSEVATETGVELLRDGIVIAAGKRQLHAGSNRIVMRDRISTAGIHRYELRLSGGDRVPENDRAAAVVRVEGPTTVLCITPDGREDRLTRSLRASGITVVTHRPQSAPLRAEDLGSFRAIVLEDIALSELPPRADRTLALFTREFGGGLLMTGGRSSFGVGGWYRSEVEDVLPVSLEVRQEQRRFGLAMAIALDRSGSMAAPVGPGLTKMDLANLGTCAAIEMLGPLDTVAVAAVDTAPHEVVAPIEVVNRNPILDRVRRIESNGGGIYVDQALEWGLKALASAPQSNKHLVVFGDAADSERPSETLAILPKLVDAGITVSVIGLGSDTDPDAKLLQDVARIGGGRIFFSADPSDLPRIFAQETTLAAKSSVCDQTTTCRTTTDVLALGDLRDLEFPTIGGYSIAWAKHGSQIGVISNDEERAPIFSFWQSGLGRSAALLAEADGKLSGNLATWPRYGDFLATVLRWLAGSDASEAVFAELTREGQDGVLTIEVDKGQEPTLSQLTARLVAPDESVRDLILERSSERKLVARFPLRGNGAFQAILRIGKDRALRVPPIMLPYSPEYAPIPEPTAGRRLLERIASESGGKVNPTSSDLMAGPRESLGVQWLTWPLAWVVLAIAILEITWRRLELPSPRFGGTWARAGWQRIRAKGSRGGAERPTVEGKREGEGEGRDLSSILERARNKSDRRL